MKVIQRGIIIGILCVFLSGFPNSLAAQSSPENDTQDIVMLLKKQNSKISDDLRRIQREIAALRADLDKPGFKDVFSGIGYILGLFGIAAFVASRRKE